jgi:hypothetical protein
MASFNLQDVAQAAAIIGANVHDEKDRGVVAVQFAALFRARFYTLDTEKFLGDVERAGTDNWDVTVVGREPGQ